MRRAGTKYARLVAKNWPIARKKGDALTLCRYVEFARQEIAGQQILAVTHEEELDCLLYEVDPKSVDREKYHEADKLIGFPWSNISHDPLINAMFVEQISGRRWLITGVLSNDPIKALTQCACTQWYDTAQIAKLASGSCSAGATVKIKTYEEEMFWSKNPSGSIAQSLTDSYAEVQNTVFGPKQSAIDAHAGQRVRFAYEASIQTTATGASGAQILFKLQKSTELDGQPEVWNDMDGAVADFTMSVDEQDKLTFAFHDQIPLGLTAGTALKYRLVAKRSDATHGATLHAGDLDPTIGIDAEFMYQQGMELEATATVVCAATVAASAEAASEASGSVVSGATVSAAGEIASAEASGAASAGATVAASGEIAAETSGTAVASLAVSGSAVAAKEAAGAVSAGATVAGAGEIAVETGGTAAAAATVSAAAEAAEDAAGAVVAGVTVTGAAEVANAEASGSAAAGATVSVSTYLVEEYIWSAPPSTPAADELGLTYEEVLGTTVTIPAKAAGYPNVRLIYNASLSLLATGASGGLCTFQLQTKMGDGAWADVTDETATKEFAAQDQEERFTFALDAVLPTGIDPDTAVQLRLVGKTVTAGREVEVHSSLIDPANTAPSCYVQAEYFSS
jgi:hypothetical protein